MVDLGLEKKGERWVCPSDRQLFLRAKLERGWSMKAYGLTQMGQKSEPLEEAEIEIVKEIAMRAQEFDVWQLNRVRNIVESVQTLRRNAIGNGTTHCGLCGEPLSIFSGVKGHLCRICGKNYCLKCCSISTLRNNSQILLCKVCSETKDMWKKTGAWFTKGLPGNILTPEEPRARNSHCSGSRPIASTSSTLWQQQNAAGSSRQREPSRSISSRTRIEPGRRFSSLSELRETKENCSIS